MDKISCLPDAKIVDGGDLSRRFLGLGIDTFHGACDHVLAMPYGYNTSRELTVLFDEGRGSCTTKHSVAAALAAELGLPVVKTIGIYPMNETLVTGAGEILARFGLESLPMVHCFLASPGCRVDLTEGNLNGKNGPVDDFLYTEAVEPNISAKDEYLLYRKALAGEVLGRGEYAGVELTTVLKAREQGIKLLRSKVGA